MNADIAREAHAEDVKEASSGQPVVEIDMGGSYGHLALPQAKQLLSDLDTAILRIENGWTR